MAFPISIILFKDITLASLFYSLFYILNSNFKDHRFASQTGIQNTFKMEKKRRKRKKKKKKKKKKKRYLLQPRFTIRNKGL